jgi:membrane protein YqaA with SNARE-associated domain
MEASRKIKTPLRPKVWYTPTKGTLGNCLHGTIGWMLGDCSSRSLDASLAIPTRVLRFEASNALWTQTGQTGSPKRSGRFCPDSHAWSLASSLWLSRVTRWFSSEPPQTPRTWCSLRQSPLMTRLPRSPSSTLVLRLNQETVLDIILSFLPPSGPHLTPLATGSLEPSLLVFSTPGGLTDNDLSRLFFTCTNTGQAATCTYNT